MQFRSTFLLYSADREGNTLCGNNKKARIQTKCKKIALLSWAFLRFNSFPTWFNPLHLNSSSERRFLKKNTSVVFSHWRNPFMLQTLEAVQQKQMKNYIWKAGVPSPIRAPHVAFLTPWLHPYLHSKINESSVFVTRVSSVKILNVGYHQSWKSMKERCADAIYWWPPVFKSNYWLFNCISSLVTLIQERMC